jgi:hypothetical protein
MKMLKLTDEQYKSLKEHMEEVNFCFLCNNHLYGHSSDCPLWEPDIEEHMEEVDFCFLCNNHLYGHSSDCPLWEPDIEAETERAFDDGLLDFDDPSTP